jgi:hypothetical protein
MLFSFLLISCLVLQALADLHPFANFNLTLAVDFDAKILFDRHHALLGHIHSAFATTSSKDEFPANLHRRPEQLLSRNIELTDASFSCASFPATYDPFLFCSGVVYYPFFLPNGMTLHFMDKLAQTYANYYPASILNTNCLSNVKRDICAAIFMPCVPNGKCSPVAV